MRTPSQSRSSVVIYNCDEPRCLKEKEGRLAKNETDNKENGKDWNCSSKIPDFWTFL